MSNDTSHDASEHLEPEANDPNGCNDGTDAHDYGGIWAAYKSSRFEKKSLWEVVIKEQPYPDFSNCENADQAILEFVRCILPPCGLHLDSARAYWQLIYGDPEPVRQGFVIGFFQEACDELDDLATRAAESEARCWVKHHNGTEVMRQVQHFIERYGDTWSQYYRDGSISAYEVALLMVGQRDLLARIDADPGCVFSDVFSINPSFAADTQEFAARFVAAVVELLRRAETPVTAEGGGDTASVVEGDLTQNLARRDAGQRHPPSGNQP